MQRPGYVLNVMALGLSLAAGLLSGCSHEVESHKVTIDAVQPDLVCRTQRSEPDLQLTVTGGGFTPQPVNVLEGTQKTILPTIELTKTLELSGAEVTDGEQHAFPGDPDEPYSENLTWQSEATMGFRITEDAAFDNALQVTLSAGIYDLTLTNPDGEHAATLAQALAVVDPPSITSVAPLPPALCIEQEPRELSIVGDSFITVAGVMPTVTLTNDAGAPTALDGAAIVASDCSELSKEFAGGKIEICKQLTVTLPQSGALPAGAYGVMVTSPAPASCSSSEVVDVLVVDPPSIASLNPTATCVADGDRQLQIGGASLARVAGTDPVVTLTAGNDSTTDIGAMASGCTAQSTAATDFMVELCTDLDFTIAQGQASGSYAVSVHNPDPVGCGSTETFEVLVVDAPVITNLAPAVSCLGAMGETVTLTGTGFATVGTAMPVITVTDDSGVATDVAPDSVGGCGDMSGVAGGEPVTLCTELVLTVPALVAGVYDVRVTNPAPVDCVSSDAVALVVAPTPTITESVPDALCLDGTDQEVHILGTGFAQLDATLPTFTLTDGQGGSIDVVADSLQGCDAPLGAVDGQQITLCTDALITVPGDSALGDYTVSIANPAPVDCMGAGGATLALTQPPTIASVAPMQVCSGGSELVVTGTGFRTGATVTVLCDSGGGTTHVVDSLASEASPDGTTLNLRFGFGAVPDETCDVIVSNALGCESEGPHPQIDAVDGPIVFYSSPPVAYNGINTQLKLFMTEITGTPSAKIVPAGEIAGEIALDSSVDPTNPRRLRVLVPAGTLPGSYDILVSDDTGCAATLVDGLEVTETLGIQLASIVQPFGKDTEDNAVTIFRIPGAAADNVPFSPTPLAFLNPVNAAPGDAAVQLVGVTYVDDDTLTAVVPAGIALGDYDLVVVDADGNVGLLSNAYSAIDVSPPVIENVFPQSIVNSDQFTAPDGSQVDQELTVFGDNFVGASISLLCEAPDGSSVQPAAIGSGTEVCDANGCQLVVTVDGAGLSPGDVCLVRVGNADGSYADYSAVGVTNSSRNLSNPTAGQDLNTARRACAAGAVQATAAARFVYAAGGDGGPMTADAPYDGVEFAPVGVFGGMQPFVDNREPLNQARAFAGSETIGRYIYVFGGSDGNAALQSAERALVLSPAEVPVITDIDLCLSGGAADCFGVVPSGDGLLTGEYAYRISAVIDPASSRNLGGETLASDPIIVRLPEIVAAGETRRVAIELSWAPPVDGLGDVLEDIIGYRIYRTPADGVAAASELLIGEVDAATFDFIDGGIDLGVDQPLAQGSTSAWQELPNLSIARNALASAAAREPGDPTRWYLYALLGMDSGLTDQLDGTPLTTFEYLGVDILPNDRQDVGGSWSVGSDTTSLTGRFLHGAWVADQQVFSSLGADQTYIYVGGGRDAPGNAGVRGSMENLEVQAGGDLVFNVNSPVQASEPSRTGFATMAAFGRLFILGGADPKPKSDASSARIVSVDEVSNSFNNEGIQLVESRYVPGRSIQSAFLFLVGGQTTLTNDNTGAITDGEVTASTEYIIW